MSPPPVSTGALLSPQLTAPSPPRSRGTVDHRASRSDCARSRRLALASLSGSGPRCDPSMPLGAAGPSGEYHSKEGHDGRQTRRTFRNQAALRRSLTVSRRGRRAWSWTAQAGPLPLPRSDAREHVNASTVGAAFTMLIHIAVLFATPRQQQQQQQQQHQHTSPSC